MSLLKVALLQMTAYGNNQAANQLKGENFSRDACMMGARVFTLPNSISIISVPIESRSVEATPIEDPAATTC